MKKLIFTICTVLAMSMSSFAQLESFTLEDFESGQVTFTEQVNVNPPSSFDVAIVDNPVKDAVNGSNKVWEWKRYDTGENQSWAGFYAVLKNEIPNGYHRIEVKFLRTNATSQLKIKCEGAVTKEINSLEPASKTNEWETLVFDIYANGIRNIRVFGFFPDFYAPIDINAVTYVDDIKIIFDPTITPPEPPTSLIFFDNSASDRFHDQSYTNVTEPSTLVREHWQEGQPNGDKLPVVTSPVQEGNALKFQWKSVEGGNWKAMVAAIDWKLFDLTEMTHLEFHVNATANISKSALPKLYFEAGSGTPRVTGTVLLSNYVDDLVANTWTKIEIPLADLWAADAAFTAKDLIKGIFFEQQAADNVEHTLYMDNIRFFVSTFVPGETSLMFDFGSDGFASVGNWNNITDHQAANNELIDNQGNATPFVLKVTDPFYNGYNTNGAQEPVGEAAIFGSDATRDNFFSHALDWGTNPANPLGEFTLSGLDASKYYSFTIFASRTGVSDNREALYTFVGNETKTGTLDASNNTSNVVSINDVKPTATGEIVLKVEAGEANNSAQKFFFIGAMKMTERSTLSSMENTEAIALDLMYKDGVLHIGDYTGIINIYSVSGSMVAQKQAVFGHAAVQLSRGIYIVKTNLGVGKVIVN